MGSEMCIRDREGVATLPGLDGRKMSKSYDNTIPLFAGAKQLKDAIARIVTDSKLPGEAKDPDNSHLFTLYQAFASAAQQAEFRAELVGGLGSVSFTPLTPPTTHSV